MVSPTNSLNRVFINSWCGALVVALYLPVCFLFIFGFNAGTFALRWEGFSLRWYLTTLTNLEMLMALFNSMFIATFSTVIAVSLAFLYSLWTHRTKQRRIAETGDALISLPLFIPEIVLAIGLLIVLTRLFKPAALELGLPLGPLASIILGHASIALGYAALVLRARFKSYDQQQELAAKDLGASGWEVLTRVMLPQMLPSLAASCCISFAVSLDDFYVSYFLSTGGSSVQTLPLYIWSLQGRRAMTPEINVVSSVLLVIAIVFFGLGLFLGRSSRTPESPAKGESK